MAPPHLPLPLPLPLLDPLTLDITTETSPVASGEWSVIYLSAVGIVLGLWVVRYLSAEEIRRGRAAGLKMEGGEVATVV
ncbi:hypothetical protein JCM24511_01335 [Saitozyma sp. JCM 24511]|nr:hypothetical protein JCM24511_01335 [Saitozyma sp. JCM 24511]